MGLSVKKPILAAAYNGLQSLSTDSDFQHQFLRREKDVLELKKVCSNVMEEERRGSASSIKIWSAASANFRNHRFFHRR
jgi:hypothetical protein